MQRNVYLLDPIQFTLIIVLFLGIVALGFALIFRQQDKLYAWTKKTMKPLWPYIIAIGIGYILKGIKVAQLAL